MKTKTLIGVAGLTILMSTVYVGAPAFGATKVGAPEIGGLNVSALKVNSLKTSTSKVTAPKTSAPKISTSKISALKVGGPAVNAPEANAPAAPAPIPATRMATKTIAVALYPVRATGQSVAFVAHVSPVELSTTKLTGSVTWKLVNHLGGRVYCSTVSSLKTNGEAQCKVDKGVVTGIKSPMSVTASYSGSPYFAPSSGSTTQLIIAHSTSLQISIPVLPTSGAPTVAYATMRGGYGISLISGHVTFIIVSGQSRHGVTANCSGGNASPTANDTRRVIDGVATCNLRQGWFIVPPFTGTHLRTTWSITATYDGNVSFGPSTNTKRGWAQN